MPMMHICIKDEGALFHGIFGGCERATATAVVRSIFSSLLAILWLAFCLSWVHTRCTIKRRTLPKVAQIMQKTLQFGWRLAVELLHLLPLFHITTNCVQWYILARCMRQCTYSMFTFFRQERVQRVQSKSKHSRSLLSYSANDRGTHHLRANLQKAQ